MSYILEALKKAQAERQIGSTPTIHAPTLASAPAGQGRAARRAPVLVAMVLMGAAIAGLATMLVRQQSSASQAQTAAAQAPAQAAGTPAAAKQAPAAPVSAQPAPMPIPEAAPLASPPPAQAAIAPLAAPASQPATPATPAQARSQPADAPGPARAASAARSPTAQPTPAATPAATAPRAADVPAPPPAPAAPAEEHIQTLQDLPEPIQRAIPQITLGGYMYSKNPADRLLLIDKVLRREGEEVAPGLLLEKLQPKQAVFSFRGYRYRVPL